ncbi:hypothetical protein WN55_05429 [Dufourea novaeangliae]|uniref:Uncharacterized protein n=1 Tax=Dufourea novaeangliae TaxID=178035 RepID=A0A154P0E8_DUFNO|nr:hypothetical protein WN55_05429 [Dufourea novaeangliae]
MMLLEVTQRYRAYELVKHLLRFIGGNKIPRNGLKFTNSIIPLVIVVYGSFKKVQENDWPRHVLQCKHNPSAQLVISMWDVAS